MLKYPLRYGDWHIYYSRTPIPWKDYHFHHDGYDGAPDSDDHRCGDAASLQDCIECIHDLEEEMRCART